MSKLKIKTIKKFQWASQLKFNKKRSVAFLHNNNNRVENIKEEII